jgi:hypothetical protein
MSDEDMFDYAELEADFTPEVEAALEVLRNAGFAVAAFSPTELQGVPARYIEDGMVEGGWEHIECLKEA